MNSGATTLRRADVLWRGVMGGVLIRRRGHDESILLTGSGVALWLALDEPTDLTRLVRGLARDHGATEDTVMADVGPAVAHLVELGVVVEQ